LVQVLSCRIGEQSGIPPASENTIASDLADFGRFREKSKTDGSQSAYALSLELSGMMLALREGPGDLTQAAESVRQAAILEPENGATRNLSACLQIWHEWKTSKLGLHARAQADQLIAATVLDAHSNTSLLNLRGLYQLLLNAPQAGRESGFSPQEIQQRLHNINAVKPVSGPELLNR
jgi:hypothetical protein